MYQDRLAGLNEFSPTFSTNFVAVNDLWFEYDQLSARDRYCLSGEWLP